MWTHTLTDKAGRTIATRTGPNDDGLYPATSYEFDDYGRVIRTRLPNYHDLPPSGMGDWTIYYTYDFFGRLKQKNTPDAAPTIFCLYDKAGRVRFMIDANGNAQNPDHIQYWKYSAGAEKSSTAML